MFITGGTGFIGSHLVDSLLSRKNIKIYALTRDLNNLKWLQGLNIQCLKGDLLNIPSLPADIEYVFHIAGYTKTLKSAEYYTVNQEGTASLFKALHTQNLAPKRIICMSSLAASGPCQHDETVAESRDACPVSPYGKSKLQGEREALKYQDRFHTTIIRVGPVFGPRDKDFLPFFKMIKMGILPAVGSMASQFSICYVKDLIKGIELCMHKEFASGTIFNIADPQPFTWDRFGKIAGEILNKKSIKIKIPLPLAYITALLSELVGRIKKKPHIMNLQKFKEMRQEAWVADTRQAQEVLSFQPSYTLRAALEETLDWYRKKGWL